MALTLQNWGFLFVMLVFVVIIVFIIISLTYGDFDMKSTCIGLLISLIIVMFIGMGLNWYNTHTASGIRAYKDFQSELSNGIDREITITAEDGREIFHYEGKVDIESNHEDNYIKFEGEDGRRYMIYYGIQDTIQIIEKKR